MEIWTPLRAHAEFITLFREMLYGRSSLPPQMVGDHAACEVGRWLASQETALGHLPQYRAAREAHADFHRCASHCLRLAAEGHTADCLREMENSGEMRRQSRRLVRAFQDLKRAVRRKELPVSWAVAAPSAALPQSS